MRRPIAARLLTLIAVFTPAATIAPPAGAGLDPDIHGHRPGAYSELPFPTFGPNVTFSDTGADGTLTAPNGQVYAFPRTNNLVANPQPLLNTFPPFTNAPVNADTTYGNPKFAYSYLYPADVFLNRAGQFVATDDIGVSGHIESAESIVMTATRQADGSFGPLGGLWSSHYNYYSGGQVAQALDLNNAGLLLGVDAGTDPYNYQLGARDFFLYDLKTNTRTELTSIMPPGWILDGIPLAIDDQGRIVVTADKKITTPSGWYVSPTAPMELLLLTPAGLSSSPIAAPEPSTLAILAVAGLGLAARRRWTS